MKRSVSAFFVSVLLVSTGLYSAAHAAGVSNGVACAKSGSVTTIKVRGLNKTYTCHTNPAIVGATTPTWTLKTCLSYWAAAKNSQDSIDQQRSLVQSMSEPDKTTYTKQLDASQASLDKVKAAIVSNHCKKGL
jgi:hypothetical protein